MANLTIAELKGIEDALCAEKLLILKYKNFAQMTADPTIRGMCEQIAAQHKNHYDTLLGNLS